MGVFCTTDILIPKGADFSKWSMVACDQYTSQPEYWKAAQEFVGSAPSTLNMILPEAFLSGDNSEAIKKINGNMESYLRDGAFETLRDSLVYVKRTQRDGRIRRGIVGAIDLEEYSYKGDSDSLIRSTEATIADRIPPRVEIRKGAPLELPHIIMLIDDREHSIIEPLENSKTAFRKLYDFDLFDNAGHLEGYQMSRYAVVGIMAGLDKLANRLDFERKYNAPEKPVLLMAVGDGNHSLAAAKVCWDQIKRNLTHEERKTHPARFALVEVMNIHDPALDFEPIQRVVFDTDPEKLLASMFKRFPEASFEDNGGQQIEYSHSGESGTIYIKGAPSNLPVGTLQIFLDEYLEKNEGRVDYIHGSDVARTLAQTEGSIAFLLHKPKKEELFKTIVTDGALPRKTFSMGEAHDKRFYLEAKLLRR